MTHHSNAPSRRAFLRSTAGVAAAVATVGSTACQGGGTNDRALRLTTLAAAEEELARLTQGKPVVSSTAWNWAQTLVHGAQSIEYSMVGFPQSKPEWFQRTVGAAAFGVFAWRGQMTHDLADPIPGAPALDAQLAPAQAVERLRSAIRSFQAWSGPLRPHFAYGALDKAQYEQAHAMHLANHWSMFRVQT